MTGPEVPISSTGWVVFIKEKPKVLGLLHENTSVLELSSTTGKFHEVILASTKMPKQPQASSLKAQFTKTQRDRHNRAKVALALPVRHVV